MAKGTDTRRRFAESFKRHTLAGERTTVSLATADAHVSRNAFYHYFRGMEDLAIWAFRDDLDRLLVGATGGEHLVVPSASFKDSFPALHYYARAPKGGHSLNCSAFFAVFDAYLYDQRGYYCKLLQSPVRSPFLTYVSQLYICTLRQDIAIMAYGRSLPEELVQAWAVSAFHGFIGARFHEAEISGGLQIGRPSSTGNACHDQLHRCVERYFADQEPDFARLSLR